MGSQIRQVKVHRIGLNACVLLLLACSFACHKHRGLETRIKRLDERVTLLELKRSETETQLRQITQIKQSLEEALSASEKRHEILLEEIKMLREEASDLQKQIDALEVKLEKAQASLAKAATAQNRPPPKRQTLRREKKTTRDRSRSVTQAYRAAMKLLDEGQNESAEKALKAITIDHANHVLAPNAHYWIGEIAYDRRRYQDAVTAFKKVLDLYPRSAKASAALLKVGKSLERLGQLDEAMAKYREVTQRFPKSRAATLAREWLK